MENRRKPGFFMILFHSFFFRWKNYWKFTNTYLDSIEAKTTKIKESWSQLWQSEGSTNTFKGLLDIGNGAIGLLNGLGLNKSLAGVGGMLVSHAMDWGGTNYQLVL